MPLLSGSGDLCAPPLNSSSDRLLILHHREWVCRFLSLHPEVLILMRFVFLNRVGFWLGSSNQKPCCYESSSRLSLSILLLFDGFIEDCNCVHELSMLRNGCIRAYIMFQSLMSRSQPDMTRFQAICMLFWHMGKIDHYLIIFCIKD